MRGGCVNRVVHSRRIRRFPEAISKVISDCNFYFVTGNHFEKWRNHFVLSSSAHSATSSGFESQIQWEFGDPRLYLVMVNNEQPTDY